MTKSIKTKAAIIMTMILLVNLLMPYQINSFTNVYALEEEEYDQAEYDFSSNRLIVSEEGEEKIQELYQDNILESFSSVYLLEFESESETEDAFLDFVEENQSVEVDRRIGIAEDSIADIEDNEMPDGNSYIDNSCYDIAVIDTGANTAEGIVSVIGDDGFDNNGHGQRIVDAIKEVCPEASVLSIKALGDDGFGDISSVYQAIEMAIEMDVKLINLSISAPMLDDSFAIEEAINHALERGIIIVSAAGNNGQDASNYIPGGIDGVITAGSIDDMGNIIATSNYGDKVDYFVPSNATSIASAKLSALIIREGLLFLDEYQDGFLPKDIFDNELIEKNEDKDKVDNTDNPSGDSGPVDNTDANKEEKKEGEIVDDKNEIIAGDGDVTLEIIMQGMSGSININEEVFDLNEGENIITGLNAEEAYIDILSDKQITGYSVNGKVVPFGYETNNIKMNATLEDASIAVFSTSLINRFRIAGSLYSATVTDHFTQYDEGINAFYLTASDTGETLEGFCMDGSIHNVPAIGEVCYASEVYGDLRGLAYLAYLRYSPSDEHGAYLVARAAQRINLGLTAFMYNDEIEALVDEASRTYVPSAFEAYELSTGSQPILTYRMSPLGELDVNKTVGTAHGEIVMRFPDYYDLSGTEYTVYSDSSLSSSVGTLRVSSNNVSGYNYTNTLELEEGTYYIKESKAGKGYKIDEEVYSVYVSAGSSETLSVTEEPEIGYLKLEKVGRNPEISSNNSLYDMSGIKYNVYAVNSGTEDSPELSKKIEEITITNYDRSQSKGSSDVIPLPPGEYWIQEDKSSVVGFGFEWNEKAKKIEIKTDETQTVTLSAEYGEIAGAAPIGILLNKYDKETLGTVPQGDGSLEDAEFEVKYFDNYTGDGSALKTWTFRTDKNGKIEFTNEYLVSGDPFYFDFDGRPAIPMGLITIKETKAPEGYILDNNIIKVVFKQDQDGKVHGDPSMVSFSNGLDNLNAGFYDRIYRGGISIEKQDKEKNKKESQGDADFSGIEFEITNRSENSVMVDGAIYEPGKVVKIITTNEAGDASTSKDTLPYGTYEIKEVKANNKYRLTDGTSRTFTIREEGQMVLDTVDGNKMTFKNLVYRGGLKIEKWDSELNRRAPQGDADFAGIQFEIVNASIKSVIVDNVEYGNGDVVYTLTTDDEGSASTGDETLPYGTYTVREKSKNGSYLLTDTVARTFTIREDKKIVTVDPFKDIVRRGDVAIQKWDKELNRQTSQGDADFAGIKFEITNKSKHLVKVGGVEYKPGEVIANTVLTTDAAGNAGTSGKRLPFGTYEIKEVSTNNKYLLTDGKPRTFVIREDGELVTKDTSGNPLHFDNIPVRGDVKIEKWDKELDEKRNQGDADFSGISFEIKNASKAAVKVDGKEYNPGQVVKTIETNAAGDAETKNKTLPYGTYTIQEVKTNDAYLLTDGAPRTFEIRKDGETVVKDKSGKDLIFKNIIARGAVRIEKWDAELDRQEYQGEAGFAGIKFEIKNKSKYEVNVGGSWYKPGEVIANTVLVTDKNGNARTPDRHLPYGTYEIREVETNESYMLTDDSTRTFEIRENGELVFTAIDDKHKGEKLVFKNLPVKGGIKAGKIDRESNDNKPQGWGTLENAEFTIYSNNPNPVFLEGKEYSRDEAIKTFRSDKAGIIESAYDLLPYGTYYIKETEAPEGYVLNEEWKVDFQIREYRVIADTTTEDMRIEKGKPAATGWFNAIGISDTNPAEVPDEIARMDMQFFKVDVDGVIMPNIPFLISRINPDGSVAEQHVIVTDEDGRVNTKDRAKPVNGELTNVNTLDKYVKGGRFIDESKLDPNVNVWFGVNNYSEKNPGALIYSQYLIEELQVEANEGMDLLKTYLYADQDNNMITELVGYFKHGEVRDLSNVFVNLIIHPSSDLIDDESGTKVATFGDEITVTDTFTYDHLKTDQRYKLLTEIFYVDREGNKEKLGETMSEPWKPVKSDPNRTAKGSVSNTVTIKTSNLEGGTLNAVDTLYGEINGEFIELTKHNENMDVESQRLYVPWMKTNAADAKTNDHVGTAEKEAEVIDIVKYENLGDQKMYLFIGELRDAETGEIIKGTDGEDAIVEKVLRVSWDAKVMSEKSYGVLGPKDGEIKMPAFKIDSSIYEGKTVVVTERVLDYDTEKEILRHDSLVDEDQSIHYLKVSTTATDVNTNSRTGVAGKTKIKDIVVIENTIPGEEYTVKGDLRYQTDGSTKNGDKFVKGDIIASHEGLTVKATSDVTTLTLEFEVDAEALEGVSGVVFEDVYHNDVLVAVHHDIEDEKQTVNFPRVKTTAIDSGTMQHTGSVDNNAMIIDRVKLENLTVGDEYKVSGIIMNSDGSVFEDGGEIVTAESDIFEATDRDMSVDLAFSFNSAELGGKSLVVFEKLYHISYGVDEESKEAEEPGTDETVIIETEVSNHEDLNDLNQTIDYPLIHTNAFDNTTKDEVGKVGETETIVDRVSYFNLRIGDTYTVSGSLRDKDTGEMIMDENNNPIVSEVTFVANEKNGYVDLLYTVNSELLMGRSIVVFEDLICRSIPVATHSDLNDDNQRIDYPCVETTGISEKTGDQVGDIDNNTVIVDTVELSNLTVGKTYKVSGVLMDKETGMPILNTAGEAIESITDEFVANEKDMTINVEFTLDGKLREGRTTVVFERLIHNDVVVSYHSDINDENQSIYTPKIRTRAIDAESNSSKGIVREKAMIIDTVKYENLLPGMLYKIEGVLMVKSTGKPFIDGSGNEVHAESQVFTVEEGKTSGEIDVKFVFNGSDLYGKSIVVFENLLHKNIIVADHSDINDEDQTVYYPEKEPEVPETPSTTPDTPQTPETPSTEEPPKKPETPVPSTDIPRTGDNDGTLISFMLFQIAVLGILIVIRSSVDEERR